MGTLIKMYYMDKKTGAYRRYHYHMDQIEAFLVRTIIFVAIGIAVYLIISL